jgi:hypothetical protein
MNSFSSACLALVLRVIQSLFRDEFTFSFSERRICVPRRNSVGRIGTEVVAMRMSKTGLFAVIAASCMLAVAAPALAESHGGGGGHGFGGGGHGLGGGGHGFGGGRGFSGGRSYGGGYGHGWRGGHGYYGHGWSGGGYGYGYGGGFLGGLGLGYALAPYYGDDYYGDDYYGGDYDDGDPGQCVIERRVWDPYYHRYIIREIPTAC